MTTTELIVCTTCRPAGADRSLPAAGQALLDAVHQAALARPVAGVAVRGVACLGGCSRACTVALQAPGKLSYVFGDLMADADADADAGTGTAADTAAQVLACAGLHAASADGQLARNDRPERLRSGILIRLPAWGPATLAAAVDPMAAAGPPP